MDKLQQYKLDYFLTGSKGILGEKFGEDYDFVLHVSHMPKGITVGDCIDLRFYLNVRPLGNSYLFKDPQGPQGIDLLIYEDPRDIKCMINTTLDLRRIAETSKDMRSYLSIKENRVILFESVLNYYKQQEST